MFDLGIQELIVIFVVALIVFGPKRLPELGRTLGKGILELKKAMEGVREQIQAESEMGREAIESSKPEEKKEEKKEEGAAAAESGGTKETKNETEDVQGSSEAEKFYRADEDTPHERKEESVDGR